MLRTFASAAFDTAEVRETLQDIARDGQRASAVLDRIRGFLRNAAPERAPVDVNGLVRTEQYGYDELYRLTSVNYGDGQTHSYQFDNMGNRSQKVDSTNGNALRNSASALAKLFSL